MTRRPPSRVLPIENMDGTPYVTSPPRWVRGTREGWRYIDEPGPVTYRAEFDPVLGMVGVPDTMPEFEPID